jgi:hypothetical protein
MAVTGVCEVFISSLAALSTINSFRLKAMDSILTGNQ